MSNPVVAPIENEIFLSLIEQYDPAQIIAIVDENTLPFLDELHQITDINIDAIQIPSGEVHKNINTLAGLWKDLTDNNFRRDGLLINLGGGVITDIGGFAAATFKRGIDFINIPTTLLAMVDASIGGKTGIDFFNFKNQIGVICQPVGVFCDVNYLKTLSKEEVLSGYAEVLKHGLINDTSYWEYCTKTSWEELDWNKVIKGSIKIKSNIVKADPAEKGLRKLLNFGHTIGHAIEANALDQGKPILHGFGVAAGMIIESKIATQQGLLDQKSFEIITQGIDSLFDRISIPSNAISGLIDRMYNDKKNHTSDINFTLLSAIGKGLYNQTATHKQIEEAFAYYSK